MTEALIYIPDISGFTNFVNNTEINHAQHIISELLEVIIDSDTLGMTVSEVEGDAVLFYKMTNIPSLPSLEDILQQARNTFVNFHHHLRRYDTERVCQCGACTGAANLSLKIIAHHGEIGFTKVKESEKPFGSTLVESHRLLKNNIDATEYLLITNNIFKSQSVSEKSWVDFQLGENEYDGKSICYHYSLLSALHNEVKDPEPPPPPIRINNPITGSVEINKPLYLVFEMVNNLDFRLLWRTDLNALEYDEGKLNRVGTKHRCLFNGGFVDFETIKSEFGKDTLVYGEKLAHVPLADQLALYYVLREKDGGTLLTIEGHYRTIPFWGWILTPIIRFRLSLNIKRALRELSRVTESTTQLDYSAVVV